MPMGNLATVLALPTPRGLAADVAARLRAAILNGHFGPGERLPEESLARSMGVSRGPIREALGQLEREGLVVIRRNRGTFVARLSQEDLDEVYSLRLVLERLAVRRAIHHADEAQFAEMQALVDTMAGAAERGITEQEAAALDVRFHEVVFQAARHQRLYECWTNLKPQIHVLLLSRNVAHPDFREYAVSAHQAILDALRDQDEPEALALLEQHLRGSYERVAVRERSDGLRDLDVSPSGKQSLAVRGHHAR